MIVALYRTPEGREFFNRDHSDPLVLATLERLPPGTKVELVQMTEAEYQAIPATNESARLWEGLPWGSDAT